MSIDIPALNAQREAFNLANPPGTWVQAWLADFGPMVTTTRSRAILIGSGKLVVWLDNVDGGVPISAVRPIDPPTEEARLALTEQRPWTAQDDHALLVGRLRGRSYKQISEAQGRPPPSVRGPLPADPARCRMMRALALAGLLALTACAATYPDDAPPRAPRKAAIIANYLIVPAECREFDREWRDALRTLDAEPDQESYILREIWTRQALANCIAPSVKEA